MLLDFPLNFIWSLIVQTMYKVTFTPPPKQVNVL